MARQRDLKSSDQIEFASLVAGSKLKPAEFARRIKVNRASVSRILKGVQNPSAIVMEAARRLIEDLRRVPEAGEAMELHDNARPSGEKGIMTTELETLRRQREMLDAKIAVLEKLIGS